MVTAGGEAELMALSLVKYGLPGRYPARPLTGESRPLKKHYDIVIIGAGGHGAATAYYLSNKHGINNIAVLSITGFDPMSADSAKASRIAIEHVLELANSKSDD